MSFLDENYLITNECGKRIFKAIASLPVIDPHNHANVKEIADNCNYSDLWQLFAATDHYVWEMLRKRGVREEFITGRHHSNEEKFMEMARVFPEIVGNPVYEWIHLDLKRYFGIEELLNAENARSIWERGNALLQTPDFRPQQLLSQKLNVEVMCSTDDPIDTLDDHKRANAAFGKTVIRPTWRPDKAMKIFAKGWREYIGQVESRFGMTIRSLDDLLEAMRQSHDYFAQCGCMASDHGLELPLGADVAFGDADAIFRRALKGESLTAEEQNLYMGCFLTEMAALNAQKGWVCQLHLGAVRDVRKSLYDSLGPDVGGDVSNHYQDFLPALVSFLNRFDGKLKVVLYCLEAGHQATLTTLARAFGANVRLGSAWWLNDTPVGMRRQLEYVGSVDLFSNFAGMVSDSRKLLSYGSRIEMFRRVLSDVLGAMVERGQAPEDLMLQCAKRMAYGEVRNFWGI